MPRDNPLFTLLLIIAVCLHTVKLHVCMVWLTTIMQKPAIARRTIAIELLRQLDRIEGYARRAQSAPTPHTRFVDSRHGCKQSIPVRLDGTSRRSSALTMATQVSLPAQDACVVTRECLATYGHVHGASSSEPATHDANGHSTISELTWAYSMCPSGTEGVWTNTRLGKPRDFSRCRRLNGQIERRAAIVTGAEPTPPSTPLKDLRTANVQDYTSEHTSTFQRKSGQRRMLGNKRPENRTPQLQDSQSSRSLANYGYTPPFSDFESSGSDATPTEWYSPSTPLSGKLAAGLDDHTIGGAEEDELDSPAFVSSSNGNEHRQKYCTDIKSSAKRKTSSVLLQARSTTNGGLLDLRASAARRKDIRPTHVHRRNLSIKLPIPPKSIQLGGVQRNDHQPSAPSTPIPTPTPAETSTATHSLLELQYKYRHIFIGTASLYTFLETLETSSPTTTTLAAIMRAFKNLAAREQLLYRQSSSDPSDWNLITRITPDISDFDCVTLARVQLGSVSLQQFVDSVPSNAAGEVAVEVVVDAFKIASHIDADDGRGAGSKARAFGTWVLARGEAVC